MEVTGKIKEKGVQQQVSASFVKRELVITTEEQYPQHILIEFTQDKIDLMDPYKIGEAVKVSINLRGREWVNPQGETKYFNSIQGWKIQRLQAQSQEPENTSNQPKEQFKPAEDYKEEEYDDLPF